MPSRTCTLLAAATLMASGAALSQSASGAPVSIADIAPKSSMLVVGVDDCAAAMEAFDRTSLRALLDEPGVKTWLESMMKESVEEFEEFLDKVDAKPEDIGPPTGMAGAAAWYDVNPDLKEFATRWFLVADYGERAAEVEKIIVDLLDEGVEDGELELVENELGDATVYTVTFLEPEDADEEDDDMDEDFEEDWQDEGPAIERLQFARFGSILAVATDMGGMERIADALAGDDLDCIRDHADFAPAIAQAGQTNAWAAAFVPAFVDMMTREREQDDGGMAPWDMLPFEPAILASALGFDQVRALSLGLRFDAPDATAELRGGALASSKPGLLGLLNAPPERITPPSFVGPDAVSLTALRVDFSVVMPALQRLIDSLPEEERAQAQAAMMMVVAGLTPLLQASGPEVFLWERLRRPFTGDSQEALGAVRVNNVQTVNDLLALYGQGVGFAPRDFEGNQIWARPEGEMGGVDFSVGVGFGHIFFGPTEGVENAMRIASRPEVASLAGEERFRRAVLPIGAPATLLSWSETTPSVEYRIWTLQNSERIALEEAEEFAPNLEPEQREPYMEWVRENAKAPDWVKDLPPASVFTRHFGDVVTTLRPTPEGYELRTLLLRPAPN